MTRYSVTGLVLVLIVSMNGCMIYRNLVSSAVYEGAGNNFSIKFPGGSHGVEVESAKTKNKYMSTPGTTYSKNFDNRTDNYRSYEVVVFSDVDDPKDPAPSENTLLEMGLNGWASEPDTDKKTVTINGMNALDSVRTMEIGPAKMTFREVVFYSKPNNKLYVVKVVAVNKANVSTPEANDFVNSLQIEKP